MVSALQIENMVRRANSRRTSELLNSPEVRLINSMGTLANVQRNARNQQIQAIQDAQTQLLAIANKNKDILNYNLNLDINRMRRDQERIAGTQKAQAAATGFSVSSQSFIDLMNNTANQIDREELQARTATGLELEKVALETEGQIKALDTEIKQVESQRESERLQAVAEQFSAATNFLSVIQANDTVRNNVARRLLGSL